MQKEFWLESHSPPVPENEQQRVEALHKYVPAGKQPERNEAVENLAKLASEFCEVPMVFVNLIDEENLFQQTCFGSNPQPARRIDSFCQFTIMQDNVFEVSDTLEDALFRENPYVTGDAQLRFYAGAPLKTPEGYNIGSLCLLDKQPKTLTSSQKKALRTLADEVISRLELTRLNRQLNEENRAKNELMRIVSHDMRNPLMGIVGFSEYLYQETRDQEKKEIFSIMVDAGKHMLGIINVMLNSDYLRNESFALNRKQLDVVPLTHDVIVLHRSFAMLKDQTLSIDLPDSLIFKLDPERWKHIVGNLLSNAIKFTPREGRVSVSLEVKDSKPQILVCRIEDTGIGLSEEQIQGFYSGDKTILRTGTEGEETTGLGMLFIKKSVELHRGKVHVKSSPGEGSVFTIEIPE